MKRLASIFLCLVLVFSFSVTSFAAFDNELDALNFIELNTDNIFTVAFNLFNLLSEMDMAADSFYSQSLTFYTSALNNILDINEFTRLSSEYDEELLAELKKQNSYLFGNEMWLTSLGTQVTFHLDNIYGKVSDLVEVLADPDDVALKDSQKNNQETIQENFFTPGSDTSIDMGKISNVADLSSDFLSAFDTSKVVGNSNPLELIGTGSDFSRWFSSENGQAMDPDYGVGSGGGGSDVPAPPTGPVYQGTNVLPYSVSNLVTGTIYNGKGFKNYSAFGHPPFPENDVYSDFYSTTGYIEVSAGDTLYIVNMDFSNGSFYEYYGSDLNKNIEHSYGIDLNDFFASMTVDENGVFSRTFSDRETESILAIRFESALISPATYITINEYPLANVEPPEEPEPEPEPIKNWLSLATTEPGGTEIYNGKGWKKDMRWSSSSQAPVFQSDLMLSGWIPCTGGDIVYLYNAVIDPLRNNQYLVTFYGSSYSTEDLKTSSPDSNGVYSFDCPANAQYFRLCIKSFNAESVISVNQYPIPETNSVSTFSLRASAPEIVYSDEVVTSFYQDRMNEFYNLLGGLNNG